MGFRDIIGHERQKAFLGSLLERERLPNALLFQGLEGVGKKKVALEFVKHLFCKEKDACGSCKACVRIEHGTHPDVMVISDEKGIGIEESRFITKEISQHPFEAKERFIIIDNAETMTKEAMNALLKTLEEPPLFNHFILITSQERDVPLTIRSRCMRLVFGLIPREELKGYFKGHLRLDDADAEQLAYMSEGSIGNGLFWMEEDNIEMRRRIAEMMTGKKGSFVTATYISERIAKGRRETMIFISFIISILRDMYIISTSGERSMLINKDLKGLLEERRFDERRIGHSIKWIVDAARQLKSNANRWLVLENMMFHLMAGARA